MNNTRLYWHDYKYFPYERDLARREVQSLINDQVDEDKNGLILPNPSAEMNQFSNLTYFKGIQSGPKFLVPDQARVEASIGNQNESFMPHLRRQNTRYSAHGLHEYRGKFNPQVVRAIGNIFGLGVDDWLLDPFCGSGTALLESAHVGWNALGLDINPLGVMIANAKISMFNSEMNILVEESEMLTEKISDTAATDDIDWQSYFSNSDYLAKWFPESVLLNLAFILIEIQKLRNESLKNVFRVVLSDICRDVSFQDPDDLRIRRRKDPKNDFPVVSMFITSLRKKVSAVVSAKENLQQKKASQIALLGDSRSDRVLQRLTDLNRKKEFDAAITSPPYATALPYIDTQRLSLCILGLIGADEIRTLEQTLIGNREISNTERLKIEISLRSNFHRLPEDVSAFCLNLLERADHEDHGFRRRNLPALMAKYFGQMAEMFESVRKVVRNEGKYALLVGCNKTTLQGVEILINTPKLLASVAESRGWIVEESLKCETYQRFDVHKKNSIESETLLILRNQK